MSAAASARRPASAWRPSPRSSSRAKPRRRSGSPTTAHEELSVTGYRPAAEIKIALLPSAQGDLKALSLTAYADTGAATNSTIAALARLIYPAEAKELADFDVISNLPPGAPFRGPGGPPMAFALEQAIDEAALRMKVDPIALAQALGSRSQPPAAVRLGAAASTSGATASRPPRRAAAIAAASASPPATGSISGSPARRSNSRSRAAACRKHRRRRISAPARRTVIANTVAQEFGLEPHEIEVRIGDSNLPEGPGSGGSRVTASIVPPTLLAIEKLKAAIAATREAAAGRPAPTRRGANCSRPRPISPRPASGRRTASRRRRASARR